MTGRAEAVTLDIVMPPLASGAAMRVRVDVPRPGRHERDGTQLQLILDLVGHVRQMTAAMRAAGLLDGTEVPHDGAGRDLPGRA